MLLFAQSFWRQSFRNPPLAPQMPNVLDYSGDPPLGRFAIVVSRYNESVTGRLLDGALQTLREAGVEEESIDVVYSPGAFEIPPIANQLAESGDYLAVICLGAVIRGETTHDEHINRAVSHHLMEIGVRTGVPCLFGVLTCQTLEQALSRAGGAKGNKGVEAAKAALHTAAVLRQLTEGDQ